MGVNPSSICQCGKEICKRIIKHFFTVSFITDKVAQWIPDDDITSVTYEKELEKKTVKKRENADQSIAKSTLRN